MYVNKNLFLKKELQYKINLKIYTKIKYKKFSEKNSYEDKDDELFLWYG